MSDYFIIPILDHFLFYAPLLRYGKRIDKSMAEKIIHIQESHQDGCDDLILSIMQLEQVKKECISPNDGKKLNPIFLGLIPTRGCNMACLYCDFPAPKLSSPIMSLDVAQKSIDMYLDILTSTDKKHGQIEFFGGEPFFQNHIAEFAVSYGKNKSAKLGIDLQFSVTTNGIFSKNKCEWIGDNFDMVTLSFDGTLNAQNKNRPLIQNKNSFDIVYRSAKFLSASNADLTIRTCISESSVHQMPDMAKFISQEFVVERICFEPLTSSEASTKNGLLPPDPYQFAYFYLLSQQTAATLGVEMITSGTDITSLQTSFCPLGKDALIITPEGRINGCYLLEKEWERFGLDLQLGQMTESYPFFQINQTQLENTRSFNHITSPLCKDCFAKYHCAGGCHVHHRNILDARSYDRLCIQTRLIIIGNLLTRLKDSTLFDNWLISINQMLETK
jgi:uncharacterized protein